MMDWRIYYSDRPTFSNEDGPPKASYGYQGLGIVQKDDSVGCMTMHGWDMYYWVEEFGQWWGSNQMGYNNRGSHRLEAAFLIQGCNVDNQSWGEFLERAKQDAKDNFPPKTGFRIGETPFIRDDA